MHHTRHIHINRSGVPSALGPLETRVMEVVWTLGDWVTVSEVRSHLPAHRGAPALAYSTIKAVLGNLVDKHCLKKRAGSKAHTFRAVQTREEFERGVIEAVVGSFLRTQRNPLLAHVANALAADKKGYAEFERLVAKKRAELRDA